SYNLKQFTPEQLYNNTGKLRSINPPSCSAHPDFGKIARGANAGWYEQYDKRTATTRTFITESGEHVYGYSNTPINFPDENGNYVAINPALTPVSSAVRRYPTPFTTAAWSASNQSFPTFLYTDGSTEISLSKNERIKFNHNSKINGHNISVKSFTVGDNG